MDYAPQINAQHPLPVGLRVFPHQAAAADARIVEYQMHRTEFSHGRVRQRLHLFRLAHIAAHGQHLYALHFQFCLRFVESVLLHIGQHEFHAELRADIGKFAAKSACAAGDDRNPALEIFHVVF